MLSRFVSLLAIVWAWLSLVWRRAADAVTGPTVLLCDTRHPSEIALGVVICAGKGAGKTSLIKRLLNCVLRLNEPVYLIDTGDKMAEHVKRFAGRGTAIRRVSAHTVGGLGIDFAAVLTTPARIIQFTSKLVGHHKGEKNPFFPTNAQLVMIATLLLLNIIAPKKWKLRDFILIATNRKLFVALHAPHADKVIDPLEQFAHVDSGRDVMGTVISYLMPLQVYAAMCEHTPANISPLDGINDGGVTILEWNDNFAPSLERVYAIVLDLVADEMLSRQTDDRVWVFADELRSLQPLDCVQKIGQRGRRSSICFIWTLHQISGLWERYGKDVANEILGLMGIKVVLKNDGPDTLRWAADTIGRCDHVEEVKQDHPKPHRSRSVREKYLVPPIDIRNLPYPFDGVIYGYVVDAKGPREFETPFLADCPRLDGLPPQVVPPEWQELKPFTELDVARLGVRPSTAVLEALGVKP